MKRLAPIMISIAVLGLAARAMSAEVDMSKLTCRDVGAMSSARAVGIAMWMNGYVHGKAGNATVDGDKAEANAGKVAAYCKKNADATLASAIEAVSKM